LNPHAFNTRVVLRQPQASDQAAFVATALRSRKLHRPWVKVPSSSDDYSAYLERMRQPANKAFVVCIPGTESQSEDLVGVFHITNIVLGVFRSGYLGYYAFAGYQQQGLMREGLSLVLRDAFKVLKLHRLEANIQPDNARSIALVAACGFAKEGYSPRYLKIGGRWRDHERWAKLAD
jgi:[ribosomal protein S5]-alanine N-acetyltransferase